MRRSRSPLLFSKPCVGPLFERDRQDVKIRFRFCERNKTSAAELQKFADQKQQFDIKVFPGRFEDNIDNVRNACPDGFTFTLIDPTGWNIESNIIFDFLRALKGEFLFNFMAEEVNRHAGWDGIVASFGKFLANPAWKGEFEAQPPGRQK